MVVNELMLKLPTLANLEIQLLIHMISFIEGNYENYVFSTSSFKEVLECNNRSPKCQFPKKEDCSSAVVSCQWMFFFFFDV